MPNHHLRRLALVAALCAAIGPLPVLAAATPSTSGPTDAADDPAPSSTPPTPSGTAGPTGTAPRSMPSAATSGAAHAAEQISAAAMPAGQASTSLRQPATAEADAGAGAFTTGTGTLGVGQTGAPGGSDTGADGSGDAGSGSRGTPADGGHDIGVTAGTTGALAATDAAEAALPGGPAREAAAAAGPAVAIDSTIDATGGELCAADDTGDAHGSGEAAPADAPPDTVFDDLAGRGEAALFVASIALVETGYDFAADRGAVSGAYLLSDADWDGHGGYRRAADAPPEVQTSRAEALAGALLASGITTAELSALWLHANSVSADGGHGGPVGAYVAEVAGHAADLAAGATLPPYDQPIESRSVPSAPPPLEPDASAPNTPAGQASSNAHGAPSTPPAAAEREDSPAQAPPSLPVSTCATATSAAVAGDIGDDDFSAMAATEVGR